MYQNIIVAIYQYYIAMPMNHTSIRLLKAVINGTADAWELQSVLGINAGQFHAIVLRQWNRSGVARSTPRAGSPQGSMEQASILLQAAHPQALAAKIKCSHILVKKLGQAEEALERLGRGEKFAKLAKEISLDAPSAKRNGNLGYFARGRMVRQFEEAAFKLSVGEISGPVKTEHGYHIIKRTS